MLCFTIQLVHKLIAYSFYASQLIAYSHFPVPFKLLQLVVFDGKRPCYIYPEKEMLHADPVPSVDDSFLHLVCTTVTVCDSLVLHLELLIMVYDATGLLCSIPNIVSSIMYNFSIRVIHE